MYILLILRSMIYNITPKVKNFPERIYWISSRESDVPTDEQYTLHIGYMQDMMRDYPVSGVVSLNPDNIYLNTWDVDLLTKIHEYSPLSRLKQVLSRDSDWIECYEIYSSCLVPALLARMANGKGQKTLKSFHIHDQGQSISALQAIIAHISSNHNIRVNWDWVATYKPDQGGLEQIKNKDRWFIGIDGEGSLCSNMRSWRNKILTSIKTVDLIINHSLNRGDLVYSIAFALINLNPHGYAFIHIPQLTSAAECSIIHVFSQCFTTTYIVHTISDKMILCGVDFISDKTKYHKVLYSLCDTITAKGVRTLPFSEEYCGMQCFTDTVWNTLDINNKIHGSRCAYYEKLLTCYSKLSRDRSAKLFESYIDTYLNDQYPDKSKRWIHSNKVNL